MPSDWMVDIRLNLNAALVAYQKKVQGESPAYFMTRSGLRINFLEFSVDDVRVEDIARGLSNGCRFAGQCRNFYSIAEHSVLVSRYVEHVVASDLDIVRAALMHDASEAYLHDVTTPLKILLPGYRLIEDNFQAVIQKAFHLSVGFDHPIVKECDYQMFLRERDALMLESPEREPADLDDLLRISCLSPNAAKRAFLERADELGISLAA